MVAAVITHWGREDFIGRCTVKVETRGLSNVGGVMLSSMCSVDTKTLSIDQATQHDHGWCTFLAIASAFLIIMLPKVGDNVPAMEVNLLADTRRRWHFARDDPKARREDLLLYDEAKALPCIYITELAEREYSPLHAGHKCYSCTSAPALFRKSICFLKAMKAVSPRMRRTALNREKEGNIIAKSVSLYW